MSFTEIRAVETGKMTGIYLALLMSVGFDSPVISRVEALTAALDTYGTCDGLVAHLGDRDTYHLDVVTAWIGLPA